MGRIEWRQVLREEVLIVEQMVRTGQRRLLLDRGASEGGGWRELEWSAEQWSQWRLCLDLSWGQWSLGTGHWWRQALGHHNIGWGDGAGLD